MSALFGSKCGFLDMDVYLFLLVFSFRVVIGLAYFLSGGPALRGST